jgi:aromatic ring-cleaving dioxygenase
VKSYVQTPVLPKKKKMYRVFMKMNTWAEVEWGDKNKEERRIKVN